MNRRVLIAMSGGVDSSVAAALLVERGYDVIGATMQIWQGQDDRTDGCCSLSAVEDARRVASALGIPHYVLNMQDEFKKLVIDQFVEEYRSGRTPNPCIRCNQFLKFDLLLKKALSLGADAIATGHYARVDFDDSSGRWLLKRAADRSKDQSYALYTMTQEQLSRTLFPLGDQTKTQTRAIAEKLGLSVADKPDSQEICFVSDNKYGSFLAQVAPEVAAPGPVLNIEGERIGEHRGIAFYTVGQRKGLGISSSGPLYVLEIDRARNAVVVGPNEELYRDTLIARDVNIIVADTLSSSYSLGAAGTDLCGTDSHCCGGRSRSIGQGEKQTPRQARGDGVGARHQMSGCVVVSAKIRYNMQDSPAVACLLDEDTLQVRFDRPQRAVTPGQSVVLYREELVVGGGIIRENNKCQ